MRNKFTLFTRFSILMTILLAFVSRNFVMGQETDNWYFGSPTVPNAGLRIDFSSGSPVVTRGYPIATEEGSSSISTAAGVPLFYTDGLKIWDASTNTTFGTGMLGGTSTTQSAIVMPKPGATNEWLVFTSGQTGTNGINYYTVTGTPGAFTLSAATNLVPANTVGEGLFIIGSTKVGSSFWVIARDFGITGIVRAWDVSNTGVVNATEVTSTLSNTGWTQSSYTSKIGTIKSNTCQNKLAFTYLNADVDLVDFDASTGTVVANTARRISVTSAGGNSGSYGIEFSPNDAYLYITNLSGNTLYRHDIAANTTNTSFGTTSNEAGQLQLGPDGKIYMAINGEMTVGNAYIGVISNPGLPGATFSATGLFVTPNANPSGYSFRGLPTFPKTLVVANPDLLPGNGTYCTNTGIPLSYNFAGSAASQVWSVNPATGWSFTTGTATSASPTITFTTANTYTVSVDITDACSRHYIKNMTLTITNPLVPAGAISCSGGSITLIATGATPADYPKYTWYDAASGGNVMGVGSPVTLNYGDNINAPASVWVEVASSVSTPTSGTNASIGMATGGLSWAANNSPYGGVPFTVISNILTLKSFVVKAWTGGGTNFDVVIRNSSSAIVFQKTYTMAANGVNFTVPINTDFTPGNYTITLNNSSIQWYGGTWAGGTNAGQITFNTFGGAGTFSIANLIYDYKNFSVTPTCSNRIKIDRLCSLPVDLISFTGTSNQGKNYLHWITGFEKNNKYFEVQRSIDGINFETIGTVAGHGNSSVIQEYDFVDATAPAGSVYYRLVQYDYDLAASASPTIQLKTTGTGNNFIVYPNPSTESFQIKFFDLEESDLVISDVVGKVISTSSIAKGVSSITVGSEYAKGSYVVRLTSQGNVSTQLIIKE